MLKKIPLTRTHTQGEKVQLIYLDVIFLVHSQALGVEKDIIHHKEVQRIAVNLQPVGAVDARYIRIFVFLHIIRIGHCVVGECVQLSARAGFCDKFLTLGVEEESSGRPALGQSLLDGRGKIPGFS